MQISDKMMLDALLIDKKDRYKVVVDNDCVWVEDKFNNRSESVVHTFNEFGYNFIVYLFNYLGVDCDIC